MVTDFNYDPNRKVFVSVDTEKVLPRDTVNLVGTDVYYGVVEKLKPEEFNVSLAWQHVTEGGTHFILRVSVDPPEHIAHAFQPAAWELTFNLAEFYLLYKKIDFANYVDKEARRHLKDAMDAFAAARKL